jgi:pilus assembly protein CpaE
MTSLALLTPDARFEDRARDVLPDAAVTRLWREEHGRIDPTKVVQELVAGGATVACLGPGLALDTVLDVAEAFDRERPEVVIILVAERSSEVLDRAVGVGVRDVVPPDAGPAELGRALARAAETAARRRSNLVGGGEERRPNRVVTVLSPKGGSGKTTVAINIGVALAAAGSSVAVVDLDLQFGDVAAALALTPEQGMADVARSPVPVDATTLKVFLTGHPSGLYALCAPETPAEGDEVGYEHAVHALRTLSAAFPTVVVDTAAGLDEHTLGAIEQSTDLVFVCGLDVAAVRSLHKELDALDQLGMTAARRHLVLNRADARVGLEVGDVQAVLGMPVDAAVPSSRAVPLSLNAGTPIVLQDPRSPAARALQHLAARFSDHVTAVATAPAGARWPWRREAR